MRRSYSGHHSVNADWRTRTSSATGVTRVRSCAPSEAGAKRARASPARAYFREGMGIGSKGNLPLRRTGRQPPGPAPPVPGRSRPGDPGAAVCAAPSGRPIFAAMSTPFRYAAGGLGAGGVALADLAERYGTPLYVYHRPAIAERLDAIEAAFA